MATSKIVYHLPDCPIGGDARLENARDVKRRNFLAAAADCCARSGFVGPMVRPETVEIGPHEYEECMIWPAGFRRPLCGKCYDIHDDEEVKVSHLADGSARDAQAATKGPDT